MSKNPSIRTFWYQHPEGHGNFGDELTVPILKELFGIDAEWSNEAGKLLGVGSIIAHTQKGDTIWGSGLLADEHGKIPEATILALRGPLTARNLGVSVPVYGDPAILMPLVYQPSMEKKHKRGYVPHYIDQQFAWQYPELIEAKKTGTFIDALKPWKEVIDHICSCEEIVSSSLHGIIIAEAYGIPAIYTEYSYKRIGGDFKFRDYLLGTGRTEDDLYKTPIPPIQYLDQRQKLLINVFHP